MDKCKDEIENSLANHENEIYIIDDVSDIDDYIESGKSDIIIGSLLFGISFLSFDSVYKNLEEVFASCHTTRSLEFIKAAAALLVPITLFSGGLTGIIAGLYSHFKKKKQSTKKLTLTKE